MAEDASMLFDNLLEVMKLSTEASDKLLQAQKITKNLYNLTENEYFKKLYVLLNTAYGAAGLTISRANLKVTGMNMSVLNEIISRHSDEEES